MHDGKAKKRVGDPLRSLAETMRAECGHGDGPMGKELAFQWYRRMRVVADLIDREHDRRMESQRESYRRMVDGRRL